MSAATPRRYALAVGAARYTHAELPALPGVAKDLPAVLAALAGLGYEPVPAFPDGILDPPTPDDVLRPLLRWLTDGFDDADTLLVHYSGHGQEEGGAHYLMCADSDPGAAEVRVSALAARHLVELPALKGVRRLLLVLDACYAGQGAVDAVRHAVRAKLALAHAPGADHRYLESFGVLSAARITDEAQDGAFSAALAHVLADEARLGHRASHISLPDLTGALNAEFQRRGIEQRADWAQLCDDTVPGDPTTGFFPNPHYVPELRTAGSEFDVAEQRYFVRALGRAVPYELAEQRRRRTDLAEHFTPRGTGRQTAADTGHYFTGRTRALRELAAWLGGERHPATRLAVVTGPPGVGKSALLGRLVALADPDVRDTVPAGTVTPGTAPRRGAITAAVHARALTLPQVVAALAAAVQAAEPTESGLRERLDRLDSVATVVVDALDESGVTHDEERRIARFLTHLVAESPRLRLLIGTRPHIVGVLTAAGLPVHKMDLAEAKWTAVGDLTAYCERLLRAPHGPGSDTRLPDAFVTATAAEIAGRAHPLYLVARLIARATAAVTPPGPAEPVAPDLPDTTGGPAAAIGRAFRWALAQQFPPHEVVRVRRLLRPLAYADGQGMPLTHWAALAAPRPDLAGRTTEDLLELLRSDAVGPYLVESLDEDGRCVYRLYHQALADDLRHDAPPDAEDHWYRRMLRAVPRDAAGRRQWREADPYLLRRLPAKAAAAGRLDELVGDAGFLVHAHPSGLAPLLHGLRSDEARLAAAVYRDHLDLHRSAGPDERRHILACDAARHRHTALLAELNVSCPPGRWRPAWAAAGSSRAALSVQPLAYGAGGPVVALCRTKLAGRQIAVAADGPEPRAWDLATGRPLELPVRAAAEPLTALTAADCEGRKLLVTGTATGAVHVHDLATGEGHTADRPAGEEPPAAVTGLVTLGLLGRRIVVGAAEDGVLRTWDLATAAPLQHRLELPDGCTGNLATSTVDADPAAATPAARLGREVIVTGDSQGVLHLWDPAEGRSTASAAVPDRPPLRAVGCALVHGLPVAVTADRQAVRIWSLRRLSPPRGVAAWAPPSPATAVSCAQLGGRPVAVVACEDASLHVLDLETRRLVASSAPRRPAGSAVGAPAAAVRFTALHTDTPGGDATTALVGAADGTLHVCDLTPPPGSASDGHTRAVSGVASLLRGGRPMVVTTGRDLTIRSWWAETGTPAVRHVGDGVSLFTGVAATAVDGRAYALTLAVNRPAEVWDLARGITMEPYARRWATAAAIGRHRGETVAVTADHTHCLRVWDLISGAPLRDLRGHTARVTALACAPQGGRLAVVSAQEDGPVRLWRLLGPAHEVRELKSPVPARAVACVRSHGRPLAVVAGADGTVRLWDGTTDHGAVVAEHPAAPTALAARLLEGRLLLATGDGTGRVTVWEADHGRHPFRAARHVDTFALPGPVAVDALDLAPGGRLVVCADKDVYAFDTGRRRRTEDGWERSGRRRGDVPPNRRPAARPASG
ncbi:AAA family ATPase [Streptomyces sp. NPDC093260]|uniref:nSTAND1 domain-containing NTPase n=1 Tax=Streptomyces sp. NPDC093260 TaxID=3155073 RepID=UPI00343F0477